MLTVTWTFKPSNEEITHDGSETKIDHKRALTVSNDHRGIDILLIYAKLKRHIIFTHSEALFGVGKYQIKIQRFMINKNWV